MKCIGVWFLGKLSEQIDRPRVMGGMLIAVGGRAKDRIGLETSPSEHGS